MTLEKEKKIESQTLTQISECILCASSLNKVSIGDIEDNVIGATGYQGEILECLKCKHAFLNPRLNSDNIHRAYSGYYTQSKENLDNTSNQKDLFQKFKEYYNFKFLNEWSFKGFIINMSSNLIPFSKFFLNRAVRFLAIPKKNNTLKLLDVGCGRGDFLIRASSCGYKSMGIDFDPETVDIACSRGLNAIVCEIDKMPNNDLYDAVVLSHVIEHVEDPVYLIENIFKRLQPGGYFYLATPNFDSAGKKTFLQNWRGIDAPRHMHYFNIANLRNLLIRTGFENVSQVYDLPQSIGVIKSSFKLKYKNNFSLINSIKTTLALFRNRFYLSNHLEVAVFKCYKSL
jgi:2-polyprenyl-3-methyl-5-hydroxy-6-metoxy-1,4-benzoquinol methylase